MWVHKSAGTGYDGEKGTERLRILIYGLNYSPELTGIGKYTGEMADWLASRGHEVRVVTAPPYYPAWRVSEAYRTRPYRVERAAGKPTVFRAPLWVPAQPNGKKRVVHLLSFMLASLPVMLRQIFWRPQLVFTVEPTFTCVPTALLVGTLCRAHTWLHIQDFEVDAAFDLGLLSAHGTVHRMALWAEKMFTNCFDRISSLSAKMLDRLVAKNIDPQHVVLFPNWVDVGDIYPLERPSSYRASLGLEDKVVFLYSGNMGAKQGLESLSMLATAFASEPKIHFVFAGDGAYRKTLETLVSGLHNVTMLPLQPYEQLNDFLNLADVHLLPQRRGAGDLVMPSKLTGILSSGRPVIAMADPGTEVAQVVEGTGLVIPPDDLGAFINAANLLANDADVRIDLGRKARTYAVNYLGREEVLTRFEKNIQELVEPGRTTQREVYD